MTEDICQKTALRILQRRREKAFSQEELGLAINKSQAWINQIESGKRNVNLKNLNDIADALECNFSDLLPEQPIPVEDNND